MTPDRWISIGLGVFGAVVGVIATISTFGSRLTGIEKDIKALQDGRVYNHACIEALRSDIRGLAELVARLDERIKIGGGGHHD